MDKTSVALLIAYALMLITIGLLLYGERQDEIKRKETDGSD